MRLLRGLWRFVSWVSATVFKLASGGQVTPDEARSMLKPRPPDYRP